MAHQLLRCLTLVLFLAAVANSQTKMTPLNLTLCNESGGNVGRFMTDVLVVQPQQYESCSQLTNTSTPVLLRVVSRAETTGRVVFVSRSEDSVQTWKIPLKLQLFSQQFYSVERTLCSVPPLSLSQWGQREGEVIIDVFTSSTGGENYTIEVTPVEDAELNLNQPVELEVSANAPEVRYFKFPRSVSSVLVQTSSDTTKPNNGCIIVSVQNASCPFNDLHQNALSKGVYQTMLSSASLPIIANNTVEGPGFFLVILVTHASVCDPSATMDTINNTHNGGLYYTHKVNVTITELAEAQSNPIAIILPVAVFFVISILLVLFFSLPCSSIFTRGYSPIYWLFERCHKSKAVSCSAINETEFLNPSQLRKGNDDPESQISASGRSYGSIASTNGAASMVVACSDVKQEEEDQDKNNEEDIEWSEHNELLKSGSLRSVLDQPEGNLYLTRMMRKKWDLLVTEYRVYGWNAITVGIFYALPAFQLVLGQQLNVDSSGNMDQCYYNFKCAHPFGVLSAFNNVWSNIGYFILGIAFLIIVFIRHCKAERRLSADRVKYCSHGVPQFYGLYYAMGFGLVLEGFMSSFYHICPSEYNFQFDTAFMFIIGGLLTVKVLQARHPDINANAFIAFFCFAVVIFLTMIGIYGSQTAPLPTRIALVVFLLVSMILFFLSFYYYHDWRIGYFFEKEKWTKFFKFVKSFFGSRSSFLPRHKIRCFKLLFVVVFDVALGISMVVMEKDGPTIVLGLFVSTFMALLIAYVLLKISFMEPWTLASVFHLLMVGLCWLSAFWFYSHNVSDWELSPSESRGLNEPCVFLFYDNHDIWHFLSAGAMFFSFLFLLTLDDGLNDTLTNKINIF